MIRRLLCRIFHGSNSVAFAGSVSYQCRRCGTIWPVPWAEAVARDPRVQEAK